MGYLGRRIGLSQDQADSNPGAADGAVGGGLLDLIAHGYFERQGDIYNDPGAGPPEGLVASGGIISDYTSGSGVYRAHVFTSSGIFNVTEIGNQGANIEYLVVAGGGGGGYAQPTQVMAGGGGAGGLRTNLTGHPLAGAAYAVSTSPGSYTVTVGAGGMGAFSASTNWSNVRGASGTNSEFYSTPVSYPSTLRIRSLGGGGGASYPQGAASGGSGGGGVTRTPATYSPGAAGNVTPDPNHPAQQGYPGGAGTGEGGTPGSQGGGGGGGAGAAGLQGGHPTRPNQGGYGGAGVQVAIAGPTATTFNGVGAINPANNQYQYFAGGGGGGGRNVSSVPNRGGEGGLGGGANGGVGNLLGDSAVASTGGGGGGGAIQGSTGAYGGSGGSGIVVVRYQIGTVATTKATGGVVSFYGNKTIHTFVNSGDFNVTGGPISIEYAMVGGGGSGGGRENAAGAGGGGGAGGFLTGSSTLGNGPKAVVIGAGGGVTADGVDTTFNSLTAGKGGYGASRPGNGNPAPLGSGGGGGGTNANAGGSGGPQGNPGGSSTTTGGYSSGGGGAGQAGGNGTSPSPLAGGYGGYGVQLPTTFRDPKSSVGQPNTSGHGVYPDGTRSGRTFPTPGGFWVAGGGGGAGDGDNTSGWGGAGGGGAGGAGHSPDTDGAMGQHGMTNTGGGGGSQSNVPQPYPRGTPFTAGQGGSGIVLIAYPT